MEKVPHFPKRAGLGVAFRCVPYSWRLYIKLAYENIAFLCCIKRTLERWRLVSLFTRNMGEAGPCHRCGTKQGWEELGWHLVPKLTYCLCPVSTNDLPPPLLPSSCGHSFQSEGSCQVGPQLGEIVSRLSHTLAQMGLTPG